MLLLLLLILILLLFVSSALNRYQPLALRCMPLPP